MRKIIWMLLLLVSVQLPAQDLAHYKRVVKELSSAKYQGRGYARGGANKAGKYLQKEFTKAGVDQVTLQPFTIDINTFPGKMELRADGKKLTPGVDFSMRAAWWCANSGSRIGTGNSSPACRKPVNCPTRALSRDCRLMFFI